MAERGKPEGEPLREKLATQAETGAGRSMARPGPGGASGLGSDLPPGGTLPSTGGLAGQGAVGTQAGASGSAGAGPNTGGPSLSGAPTNDAYRGGGTVANDEDASRRQRPAKAKA
jgi:hypothetical protein